MLKASLTTPARVVNSAESAVLAEVVGHPGHRGEHRVEVGRALDPLVLARRVAAARARQRADPVAEPVADHEPVRLTPAVLQVDVALDVVVQLGHHALVAAVLVEPPGRHDVGRVPRLRGAPRSPRAGARRDHHRCAVGLAGLVDVAHPLREELVDVEVHHEHLGADGGVARPAVLLEHRGVGRDAVDVVVERVHDRLVRAVHDVAGAVELTGPLGVGVQPLGGEGAQRRRRSPGQPVTSTYWKPL